MKIANRIPASQMLEILNNNWLTTKDIMLLAPAGISKATKIKKTIEEKIKLSGRKLPAGYVPVKEVIEELGIDVKYLKKVAKDGDT